MKNYVIGKKSIILTALAAVMLAFIFGHSAMPAEVSADESGNVTDFIRMLSNLLGIDVNLTDTLVRKAAHFCEYFAYGLVVSAAFRSYRDKLSGFVIYILSVFLSTALIDETIQYFPPGRSAQVNDVWLDFAGAATALAVYAVIIFLIGKHKK